MSHRDHPRPNELFLFEESATDRAARIGRISEGIARGTYCVAAGDVADSLVAFFARDAHSAESGNPDFDDKSC